MPEEAPAVVNEERRQQGIIPWDKVPWWVVILLALGLFLTYLIMANPQYHDTFNYLRSGVVMTLRITFSAYIFAVSAGLLIGLARTSKNKVIYTIATLYVEIMRGIPMVVLMLYVAFALVPATVGLIKSFGAWGLAHTQNAILTDIFTAFSHATPRDLPMDVRAIIALAMGYAAFEAEVFRAGIQSIGRGQMEAALSLGMNYFQAMRFVILPQAVRRVLPPLGNDFVALLKDSSLATVLAVREITQMGRLRRASTFRVMETFNVVAYLYLSMTLFLSGLVRLLEQKMKIKE
ncbi:MAG TPA: amino acid ABC transporter permease [Chloroflexi bacterium]|nr:amino acid ABC transporter permease [Chloroflexota bacterium]